MPHPCQSPVRLQRQSFLLQPRPELVAIPHLFPVIASFPTKQKQTNVPQFMHENVHVLCLLPSSNGHQIITSGYRFCQWLSIKKRWILILHDHSPPKHPSRSPIGHRLATVQPALHQWSPGCYCQQKDNHRSRPQREKAIDASIAASQWEWDISIRWEEHRFVYIVYTNNYIYIYTCTCLYICASMNVNIYI